MKRLYAGVSFWGGEHPAATPRHAGGPRRGAIVSGVQARRAATFPRAQHPRRRPAKHPGADRAANSDPGGADYKSARVSTAAYRAISLTSRSARTREWPGKDQGKAWDRELWRLPHRSSLRNRGTLNHQAVLWGRHDADATSSPQEAVDWAR